MSIQKFRPYLTIQQIRYIVQLIDSDNRSETEALRLKTLRELKLFIAKSDIGAVAPSLVTVERKSMTEQLGFSSPAEQREAAYKLWSANPQLCTEQQIQQATLYRYENNLMSPEEEAQYESDM